MKWQGRRQSNNVIDVRNMSGRLYSAKLSKARQAGMPLTRAELDKKPRLSKKGPRLK